METQLTRRDTPSLLAVNVFLLLGILIIIGIGSIEESVLPQYVMAVAGELVLVLIVLLFVRIEGLSVRETLRLRWPGWPALALSVVLAIGLWMAGVILNVVTMLVFGYSTPVSPSAFPKDGGDAMALLLATVVAAPLCEEVAFRGYVQRAYDRGGRWAGLLTGGLIFAMYHLRFQGLFALLPVSFALGFVAWRSHSLLPAMLLHAVYNSIAALLMIATSFFSMQVVAVLVFALVCLGLLMLPLALGALWLLWRRTSPPASVTRPKLAGWRRWGWAIPLFALLLVYGYAAVLEVVVGRFPEILAVDHIALQSPGSWDSITHWRYAIHNRLDQPVGDAECAFSTPSGTFALACRAHQDAFDSGLPLDMPLLDRLLTGEERAWQQDVTWSREDLRLLALDGTREGQGDVVTWALSPVDGTGRLTADGGKGEVSEISVPVDVLVAGEWPWRLAALPFEMGYGGHLPFAWIDDTGEAQVSEAYVGVRGGEPVWTPAGAFVTWKVTVTYEDAVGEELTLSAWYDTEVPHTLVRYDEGNVSYVLAEIQ